ncbi:MAG: lysylphosphatidylglycerol synthase domain-containing protein [Kineosporiaceae bacterium]
MRGSAVGLGRRLLAVAQSRPVRIGFVTVAVGLAVWALWSRWPQVLQAVQRLDAAHLAAAALATVANLVLTGLAWRALLADLGARLPVGLAARVFFVGQVGKYVPGSVWPMIVQAELAKRHVARRSTAAATLVLILLSGASALVVVLVALPFGPSGGGSGVRWAALLVLPAVALLHPAVLGRLLDRGLRLLGREPLERWTTLRGTAAATAWALAAWFFAGLQVWLLAVPLGAPATWRTLALATGGYALAWAIGLVVVVAPAGAGAREVALAAFLSPVLDRGAVVVVVLLSRVLFTAADLALAGVGFAAGRGGVTPPAAPASQSRGAR